MMTHHLEREMSIPLDLREVFDFFSKDAATTFKVRHEFSTFVAPFEQSTFYVGDEIATFYALAIEPRQA